MWSQQIARTLRRSADSYSSRLSLGAALSLAALVELDRRQENERDDNDGDVMSSLHCFTSSSSSSSSPHLTACQASAGGSMSAATASSSSSNAYTVDKQLKQDAERRALLRTRQTVRRMEQDSVKDQTLESRYAVDWRSPLGQGSFGVVYLGMDKDSQEHVAVKKISKKHTNAAELQLEMRALLHLRESGGHPNICSLRENFSEGGYYYLILDLVAGGELFDALVSQGAYSELDAARHIREAASALAFLHGTGIVHCDLKPENWMLSSPNPSNAVIKLIDFGCSVIIEDEDIYDSDGPIGLAGRTLAYCPPEMLDSSKRPDKLDPSVDMWAIGVILYIMLTGIHPFDLSGQATDEEVAQQIIRGQPPPLRNSPITAHLSASAIDLIDRLMQRDPCKRLTADQMLEHPWTRGITANRDKMADSDKKLAMYRVYKSGIAEKVFENIISWSDDKGNDDVSRRTSLIERSFRKFDSSEKGYLTRKDLQSVGPKTLVVEADDQDSGRLSLSGFSDLLAENMKNRYFPKGKIVYREGDVGNAMYYINSGTISVETAGSVVKRGPGDFFGEGALLSPTKRRSATIRCDTPVHAMEISREYFESYLAKSDQDLLLTLREKDKIRKRNRAKMILQNQKNLRARKFKPGEFVFDVGQKGDSLFLVESGVVDVVDNGNHILSALPGNVFGEYSAISGRPRNCSAICGSAEGCVLKELSGREFRKLKKKSPDIVASLNDLRIRRDFKKAVVKRLKKEFPYDNPREAFDAVKTNTGSDRLDVKAVGSLMRELNPNYTDDEILEVIRTLDLTNSGDVNFDEFKKIFVSDIRKSASI